MQLITPQLLPSPAARFQFLEAGRIFSTFYKADGRRF
jgi:hypothetical protein